MRRWNWLVAAGLIVIACGCAHHGNDTAPTPYRDRLNAAGDIADRPSRDQALKEIAVDAAATPDVVAVREAIRGINNGEVRDEAAEGAAIRLKQSGQPQAAMETAARIGNETKRDQTMRELSER
jgi:hypothetical protein